MVEYVEKLPDDIRVDMVLNWFISSQDDLDLNMQLIEILFQKRVQSLEFHQRNAYSGPVLLKLAELITQSSYLDVQGLESMTTLNKLFVKIFSKEELKVLVEALMVWRHISDVQVIITGQVDDRQLKKLLQNYERKTLSTIVKVSMNYIGGD